MTKKQNNIAALNNAFAMVESHDISVSLDTVFVPVGKVGDQIIEDLKNFHSIDVKGDEPK